mmetsp:Transcript_21347/g.36350  ORF Transcript_21347/g.36350 Transcript_21347/m.36350 type:complete len:215 (-) Transcript_21347:333-977(-)
MLGQTHCDAWLPELVRGLQIPPTDMVAHLVIVFHWYQQIIESRHQRDPPQPRWQVRLHLVIKPVRCQVEHTAQVKRCAYRTVVGQLPVLHRVLDPQPVACPVILGLFQHALAAVKQGVTPVRSRECNACRQLVSPVQRVSMHHHGCLLSESLARPGQSELRFFLACIIANGCIAVWAVFLGKCELEAGHRALSHRCLHGCQWVIQTGSVADVAG